MGQGVALSSLLRYTVMIPKTEAWLHWGYIGIMENEMESTVVYWGYMG